MEKNERRCSVSGVITWIRCSFASFLSLRTISWLFPSLWLRSAFRVWVKPTYSVGLFFSPPSHFCYPVQTNECIIVRVCTCISVLMCTICCGCGEKGEMEVVSGFFFFFFLSSYVRELKQERWEKDGADATRRHTDKCSRVTNTDMDTHRFIL